MARRFLILPLALLAAALWAPSASALVARPDVGPQTLTSDHVAVHFTGFDSDPVQPHAIRYQEAADLAAILEEARAALVAWGYPLPLDDGDGRIDVWVADLRQPGETEASILGMAVSDTTGLQSSGYVVVHFTEVRSRETLMHELFHLSQNATWRRMSQWLKEATAQWAGHRFAGFGAVSDAALGPPDLSLDCASPGCGTAFVERGYTRWPFFQYAAERYGSAFVQEVFTRGQAVGDPTVPAVALLDQVLASKGSSLSQLYGDFSAATLSGALAAPSLASRLPTLFTRVATGSTTAALPTMRIAVNHLATRYVAFERGPSEGACHAARLRLTVTLPDGVAAVPHFHWSGGGGTATPLSVSGSTATLDVPWDTCTWEGRYGILSLPNASHALDARTFTVAGIVTVDRTRVATATPPPAGWITGAVVPVPLADPAPSIAVHGPSSLSLDARDTTLRLVVFSSGPGKLEATFGGRAAGTFGLRSGNNVLRVRVPLALARRTLAQGTELRLTSVAPSGIVYGASVSRTVRLHQAPKRRR